MFASPFELCFLETHTTKYNPSHGEVISAVLFICLFKVYGSISVANRQKIETVLDLSSRHLSLQLA